MTRATRAAFALLLCAAPARTQTVSTPASAPPCGIGGTGSYPALGELPLVKYLRAADVSRDLDLTPCTGWIARRFSTLVTTAARFRFPGGADGLLARIGAISLLADVRYWSTSHKQWQRLILSATALAGAKSSPRRADFTCADLCSGDTVYFQQTDNLSGTAIYRLRMIESARDHLVFTVENVNTIRYAVLTLFRPAELQSIHFFDRDSSDVWRYYGIIRTGEHASGLATGHAASSINRAVAIYRHYAGIRTDLEPPMAR
ncbi:MAG TPA: DUF6675 family protein [Gemmatimonadaceae bacterium]|nr:DUF6675 family protein [Gemmatimonadaceae bacterium]